MPPGGLHFLFRQEMEERSRVKGVAERSESSNKMIAGGNHTLSVASSKGIPVAVPDICLRWQSTLSSVDRCHSLSSLSPPPAALASLPPAASKMARWGIHTPKPETLYSSSCVRRITHCTYVSMCLGLAFYLTAINPITTENQ